MAEQQRISPGLIAETTDSGTLLERLQRSADVLARLSAPEVSTLSPSEREVLRQEASSLQAVRGEVELLLRSWSLLTDTSRKLLNLPPNELGAGVRAAMEVLGRHIDAQRGYVNLLSDDGEHLAETYEWCAPGVRSYGFEAYRGQSVTSLRWTLAQLREGRMVTIPDTARLPPEAAFEQRACEGLDIRSYVNTPLLLAGRLIGWMGFDAVGVARDWTLEERHLMGLTGHILVNGVERMRRDAQLLLEKEREQRAQSLGILAASLAHEINNPLAFTTGNLEYLKERLPAPGTAMPQGLDGECHEVLDEALEGATRIQRIVADLKSMAAPADEAVEPVDLKAVTESTLRMAANQLRHRAQVVRDYAPELPRVRGTTTKLGQVLLNLLLNAVHAIPEGHVSKHRITVALRARADDVLLSITDTGSGIAPDVLPRIFDPFFTTRRESHGMGMGLAICRNIITALGGHIGVRSAQGLGTTVEVSLPRSEHAQAEVATRKPVPPTVGKRLLVVDDEPRVLDLLKRLLRGHELVTAANGLEALEQLRADHRFDLILCDLMMPELTGMDVYHAVRETWPGLHERIVFLSGGAFTHETKRFLAEVPNRVVTKPFEANHLRELVTATDAWTPR
ncbi:hybrid sensor histidine kinase/response regulator [Myxococcus sp. K15C18031901]|uniref:hybrid sensor histidine kinase/response regulator n=1 Tax=Myxococcus dinghuensis TaxID=2906761 RepID=UPI0020A7936F|nr:ATP-binding protein [Myxococcus dinghuensis]MCP3101745.1 hybrid sensor histidine kinase/response regulator [Myxococcus dinghuensis]